VQPQRSVLGLASHSGWAAAVLVGGSGTLPRLLARERLEITDDTLAGSRQPYHHIESLPLGKAREELARFEGSAGRIAARALRGIVERARAGGTEPAAAGILDASGRSGSTLAAILASHALIHAAEGEHFRAALARGCEELGLRVTRIPRRELEGRAAAALGKSAEQLAATLRALGRGLGPPWGADQKTAALLAWMLLA